ncbi:MAG TPA: type VI secretion system-associated FHA domain protein TagH [Burkholderiaceae bacterium]|nr:type VI secretion system-associated FHA domain protein TagH [Burkholderiaceae bacterium]
MPITGSPAGALPAPVTAGPPHAGPRHAEAHATDTPPSAVPSARPRTATTPALAADESDDVDALFGLDDARDLLAADSPLPAIDGDAPVATPVPNASSRLPGTVLSWLSPPEPPQPAPAAPVPAAQAASPAVTSPAVTSPAVTSPAVVAPPVAPAATASTARSSADHPGVARPHPVPAASAPAASASAASASAPAASAQAASAQAASAPAASAPAAATPAPPPARPKPDARTVAAFNARLDEAASRRLPSAAEPTPATAATLTFDIPAGPSPTPAAASTSTAEPAAAPSPPSPSTPSSTPDSAAGPPSASADADPLLAHFLKGAGLAALPRAQGAQQPTALTPELMERLGELLRATTEGTIQLIQARATVKREMRAEVTLIAERQNNPLKFSPDAAAALSNLLRPDPVRGFLDPVAALRDAFDDLLAHQVGFVAGMRAAMTGVLDRFDPAQLELDLQVGGGRLAALVPALRKARLWDRFDEAYARMVAEAEDDFESFFGREFVRAYERQIDLLQRPDADPPAADPAPDDVR